MALKFLNNGYFAGKVGIGTESPSVALQLGNSTLGQTKLAIFNSEGGGEVGLTIQSRTNRAKLRVADNDSNAYVVAEAGKAFFGTSANGDATNVTVLTSGNVGIGTTSPASTLDIRGSGGYLQLTSTSLAGSIKSDFNLQLYADPEDGNSSGYQNIQFFTAGASEKMRIGYNGRVGIGTTSPAEKLEVSGGHIKITNAGNTNLYINANAANADATIFFEEADSVKAKIQHDASNDSLLFTDGSYTDTMTLKGGNVGINCTPSYKLQWSDGTRTGLLDTNIGAVVIGSVSNDALALYTNLTEKMRITSTGNVGIGTTNPGYKLQVSGGNAMINGGSSNSLFLSISTNYLYGDVNGVVVAAANNNFRLNTNGSERMRINSAGAVLINATAVRESVSKLSVQGGMSEFETTLTNGNDWANSPISILERGNIGSGSADDKYSPNLNFHWSGRVSNSLWMSDNGHLNWGSYTSAGVPAADGVFRTKEINLIGTGRITGVDTVSASTDAANKAYVDAHGGGLGPFLPLAGGTMTGDINFNDNVYARFGNQPDFEIGHDTNNSYINHTGVGNLIIQNTEDNADIIFKSDNGSGGVAEYFRIDGGSTMNVFSKPTWHGDGVKSFFGNSQDLEIYHDGSNSYIKDNNAGNLLITSNGASVQINKGTTENMAEFIVDGAVKLYYDSAKKLETGIVSVGAATTTGGTLIDGWITTTQANAINNTTIATTAYVNNKIALIPAGLVFQGTWNASTNTPTLTSGSGTTGNFYIVSTPGSTNLDGITDWKTGDWAVFIEQGVNDQWEKIDNSSVLDGIGTGQTLPLWSGSGTSNTLTDSRFSQTSTKNIITGPGNAASDKSLSVTSAANTEQLYIQGTGEVVVSQNYFYVSASQGMYSNGLARFRGGITNDQNNPLLLGGNGSTANLTLTSNTSATFAGTVLIDGVSNYTGLTVKGATSSRPAINFTNATQGNLGTIFGTETRAVSIGTGATGVIALTLDSSQNATFAGAGTFGGQLTVNPNASTSIRIDTAGTNAGLVFAAVGDELYLGANNVHQIRLKTNNDVEFVANATFAGDVTATANYTAGNSKIIYKAQRSGGAVAGDWSYDDATTDMSLGTSTAHSFSLKAGNTRALTINTSQNATFAGNVAVQQAGDVYLTLESTNASTAEEVAIKYSNQSTGSNYWWAGLNQSANYSLAYGTSYSGANVKMEISTAGEATFAGDVLVEDNLYLTDAGTVRGKIQLNASDRDDLDIKAVSLGSNMKFFTVNTERMRLAANGNVGIGTTAPQAALHVAGPFDTNSPTGNGVLMGFYSGTHGYMQLNGPSGGYIDFSTSGTDHKGRILYDNTGNYLRLDTNGSEKLRINSAGNVGIGTSIGINKLDVAGNINVMGGNGSYLTFNNGDANIVINNNGTGRDLSFKTYDGSSNAERMRIDKNGNVGIGVTGPAYKLDVNGGIQAGGKVTYSKQASSLDTTGYAVAGITALPAGNGFSCGFTFTCFGGAGKYQKLVYSCYNSAGTWNAKKVIDEGTNDIDVVASANGATITFTFKARSSTQSFTPRVTVEAVGTSINSTYA